MKITAQIYHQAGLNEIRLATNEQARTNDIPPKIGQARDQPAALKIK